MGDALAWAIVATKILLFRSHHRSKQNVRKHHYEQHRAAISWLGTGFLGR